MHRASAQLTRAVAQPALWKIAVKGDILSLTKPVSALSSGLHVSSSLAPQPWRPISAVLCPSSGNKPSKKARIISMASIESSYGYFAGRCPDSFDHPDVPALRVAATVLNNLESFFVRDLVISRPDAHSGERFVAPVWPTAPRSVSI